MRKPKRASGDERVRNVGNGLLLRRRQKEDGSGVEPCPAQPDAEGGVCLAMALAQLAARLNCTEYKNWVKAGHSLLLLRAALQRYAGEQVQAFHRQLVARGAARLTPSGRGCRGSCIPRGRQVRHGALLFLQPWERGEDFGALQPRLVLPVA
ncbi:UNVERIFIED_CONTAM: hypothetical protein K2H54_053237 [Gekko kuhli]